MNSLYNKTVKFVDEAFGMKKEHFARTVYWVKKLKPDADLAMLIAAYAHDIQRAFSREELMEKIMKRDEGFQDTEMLKTHQDEGAKIIGEFLDSIGADQELVE